MFIQHCIKSCFSCGTKAPAISKVQKVMEQIAPNNQIKSKREKDELWDTKQKLKPVTIKSK